MAKDRKSTDVVAHPNQFEAAATSLVGRLVDIGIDGLGPLGSARQVADKALREAGVNVDRVVPIEIDPNPDNEFYLRTKRDRMGHDLPAVARWEAEHEGADS